MNADVPRRRIATYFHVDEEIVSFIPELLAEFDELGSDPASIVALLRELSLPGDTRVLDLGCGLGAVSRAIAGKLGFRVTGVDMLPSFVAEARRRAAAAGCAHLCHFVCDDMGAFLAGAAVFDVVLLISVGDALGPMDATVGRLRRVIRPDGYMIIDDGYGLDDQANRFPGYEYVETRDRVIARLTAHGDELCQEVPVEPAAVREQNRVYLARIARSVRRLSREHPEHREAFERYLDSERRESDLIENHLACVTWVLKRSRGS